ncbi:hypothetical protein Ocin01_11328 [Orchesella cincta]|uniref:Uncharacterized protein n=1 Tax=Orchesella cincta TaxID=48709 RepID=A0A1D2MR38_ORCCI|nr:hypothetical protein Ocin01_11328 [Orchesella cincta]
MQPIQLLPKYLRLNKSDLDLSEDPENPVGDRELDAKPGGSNTPGAPLRTPWSSREEGSQLFPRLLSRRFGRCYRRTAGTWTGTFTSRRRRRLSTRFVTHLSPPLLHPQSGRNLNDSSRPPLPNLLACCCLAQVPPSNFSFPNNQRLMSNKTMNLSTGNQPPLTSTRQRRRFTSAVTCRRSPSCEEQELQRAETTDNSNLNLSEINLDVSLLPIFHKILSERSRSLRERSSSTEQNNRGASTLRSKRNKPNNLMLSCPNIMIKCDIVEYL